MSMKAFTYLAPIAPFEYIAPTTVDEALQILNKYGSRAKVIAGGTDLTILLKDRVIKPDVIIDVARLRKNLAGIRVENGTMKIGALTTFTEIENDPQIGRFARALHEAASHVGTHQIRNLGTIGGNLANASPSADSAPPLISLCGKVHTICQNGERTMPVEELFTGVKKTTLQSNEIITHIEIPANEKISSYWVRSSKRNENAISVVSVAVACEIKGGQFGPSRISLGSAAPTPIFAKKSSARLSGSPISEETIEAAADIAMKESIPSARALRAGPEYRRHLVYVLTKRTIEEVSKTSR